MIDYDALDYDALAGAVDLKRKAEKENPPSIWPEAKEPIKLEHVRRAVRRLPIEHLEHLSHGPSNHPQTCRLCLYYDSEKFGHSRYGWSVTTAILILLDWHCCEETDWGWSELAYQRLCLIYRLAARHLKFRNELAERQLRDGTY